MAIPATEKQDSTVLIERFLLVFVVLASLFVIAVRAKIAAILPLWLDETWSAMISSQHSWPGFWREAWLDCNPPLYYMFLAGWTALFGDSNLSLRIPSLLFGFAAALLPVLWRPAGLNKAAIFTFAGLLLLWPSNLFIVTDARGYGLMLLLSAASCLTLARLLEELTLKWTAIWVALGTMMFMTHYFAATLVLGQALVVFCRYRLAMLKMWPAAAIALPGLAWFAFHLPRLKEYARPDVTWYDPTTLGSVLQHLTYVAGVTNFIALAVVTGIVALMIYAKRRRLATAAEDQQAADGSLVLAATAAAIGVAIAILIGLAQDSLADRYFVPFVPPAMLALALIIQRCPKQKLVALLVMFTFLLPVLNARDAEELSQMRANYGYEEASQFITSFQPDEVVFLWDHPAAKILDDDSLNGIGSYFIRRSGNRVPVRTIVVPENADGNAILRANFSGKRPAFIWLYDTGRRSAAGNYPPTFAKDPQWACRHRHLVTGKGIGSGTIACAKVELNND